MKRISNKAKLLLSFSAVAVVTGIFFTNCAKSSFTAQAPDVATVDPLLDMAWHIHNTGQKVFATVGGVAGIDLNLPKTWGSGISGKGVKVLVSDDGIEDTHEDLTANYLYANVSKDYTKSSPYLANTAAPIATDDNHGTSVAGLIAAVADNGVGTKGVAPKASLVSANFLSSAVSQTESILVDQANGDYDIFNMSWGATQNNLVPTVASFQAQMLAGVTYRRGGKGAIYVKSAGNDFYVYCRGSSSEYCVGSSNFDGDNTSPYTILTSAINASGEAASYSSMGSNVWVASYGGEFGDDSPAMLTTDRTGCSKGFSMSNVLGLAFEKGSLGNSNCNYTVTFNGTSAAAPVLSGAVALLLQANPNLTWRDVKYILAKTAIPVNYTTSGSIPHPLEAIPAGAVWERAWVQNSAGFKFHNWFGFGRVSVDDAVALAKSYTSPFGSFEETSWSDDTSGLNLSIPDNSATGVTHIMAVTSNLKIEAVQLKVWITHTDISDLAIELTSPSGTKSYLVNMNNSLRGIANYQGDILLTNAFYQERSQGAWMIKVIDGKSTHTGTLTRWSLNFFGSQ